MRVFESTTRAMFDLLHYGESGEERTTATPHSWHYGSWSLMLVED